jgi:LysR family glycine cleavage system transcriptional activator
LVGDALAAGLLETPFSVVLPGEAYHFVCAEGLETRADIANLRSWFARELANGPHRKPTRSLRGSGCKKASSG